MARKDSSKPMLPAQPERPSWFVQCAADTACRKPGRMWVEPYLRKERVCVDHYYETIDKARAA